MLELQGNTLFKEIVRKGGHKEAARERGEAGDGGRAGGGGGRAILAFAFDINLPKSFFLLTFHFSI